MPVRDRKDKTIKEIKGDNSGTKSRRLRKTVFRKIRQSHSAINLLPKQYDYGHPNRNQEKAVKTEAEVPK